MVCLVNISGLFGSSLHYFAVYFAAVQTTRWLAALLSTLPLLLLIDSDKYAEILLACAVHFSLLMIGLWLPTLFLKTEKIVLACSDKSLGP